MSRLEGIGAGVAILALAMTAWSCGEVARQGRSPSQVTIIRLDAAAGRTPTQFGSPLYSDVLTYVQVGSNPPVANIFSDIGRVEFSLTLKDPGAPGVSAAPSPLNQVTFTRFHVTYRRSDGRNTQGVDVPYAYDGAFTVTVPATGTVIGYFELVRSQAKAEQPLRAMINAGGQSFISTIADVTFYGADQAGNTVVVTGSIGVDFGDFGDPS